MIEVREMKAAELESFAEFPALAQQYAEETGYPEMPLPVPQRSKYYALEASGVLFSLGAINEVGELVGIISMIIAVMPHYGNKMAVGESFFVAPEHRKTRAGIKLLQAAEKVAKREKALACLITAQTNSTLCKIMPLVGYRDSNSVFFKRLS